MVREYKKNPLLFVIPVVVILLLSVVVPTALRAEEGVDEEENDTNEYIIREPIRINGNDDFAAQATAEGWPGDGSEGNPYVIEGYEINGTGYGYGIYISNINVHFVVRDCYVHNASGIDQGGKGGSILNPHLNSGIILSSVQNGKIENNTLINNANRSIYLGSSTSNVIIHNNISHNVDVGISLSGSNNNTIIKNTLSNNIFGIGLAHSLGNIIIHNDIYHENGSSGSGINLQDSYDNIINNNTISNHRYGIFEDTCDRNVIEDNIFIDNEVDYDYAYEVNGPPPNNNGDETPTIGFPFFVIIILAAIMVIWLKKDKIKELKK